MCFREIEEVSKTCDLSLINAPCRTPVRAHATRSRIGRLAQSRFSSSAALSEGRVDITTESPSANRAPWRRIA